MGIVIPPSERSQRCHMGKQRIRLSVPVHDLDSLRVDTDLLGLPVRVNQVGLRLVKLMSVDFHRPIISRLIRKGKLLRTDLKAGRSYNHRLMVNFIRHTHVNREVTRNGIIAYYLPTLEQAILIAGFEEGYRVFNTRVLDAIKEAYPKLADECESQKYEEPLVQPEDIFRIYSTVGNW
jgi:hypothetical protein